MAATLVGALPHSLNPLSQSFPIPAPVATSPTFPISRQIHVPIDLSKFKTNSSVNLLSPKYDKSPPLGNVLKTPPDISVDLPKVPQRQQLLGIGTVVRADSPKHVELETQVSDLMDMLPSAPPKIPSVSLEPSGLVPGPTPISTVNNAKKIEDAKERANYRVKFSILRDAYPQMNIPEPEENQGIEEVKAMYQQYVKRIHIDSSVEQNKVYLLVLWLVIELVGAKYLNLPIIGYTASQEKYMNKYRMLLIELGERSYAASLGEAWPVEVRILTMAVINGVIFLLVQLVAKKLGGEANPEMASKLAGMVDEFLMKNKGTDVLRKANEATVDNPPPETTTNDTGVFGGIGNIISGIASAMSGQKGTAPAPAPQMRRPAPFGARRRGAAVTPEV